MNTQSTSLDSASGFVSKLGDQISGTLHGFDRLRLRGTLRQLYCPAVMEAYLSAQHLMYRDFAAMAERATDRLKAAAEALAARLSRPLIYLTPNCQSKEALARQVAERDSIEQGLIGVFKTIEPCQSHALRRKADGSGFEFRLEARKCLHFYFYFEHERFGFMHVRLQSWFPFEVDICLNGRHWLARQLDKAGVAYRKRENALVWVDDMAAAQRLMDRQKEINWHKELEKLLKATHPTSTQICRPLALQYYWSVSQSEYATDLLFKRPEDLARIYPSLVHHALRSFGSPDVMRFLGHKVPAKSGRVTRHFKGEVVSDLKDRPEGIRVKHRLNGNSIKLYDKQGSVLRVETTINHPKEFRVYRRREGDPQGARAWRVMRRGVGDLARRAEVCHAANQRYLQALGAASNVVPLFEWTTLVCRPIKRQGRRYRALNPFSPTDAALLRAVSRGEFAINGFRNRDLRQLLHPGRVSKEIKGKQARATGRQIRLLRMHGLLAKVSHTHRYVLTEKGRFTITALLAAQEANTQQLTQLAA
jgi:hypothetical protein